MDNPSATPLEPDDSKWVHLKPGRRASGFIWLLIGILCVGIVTGIATVQPEVKETDSFQTQGESMHPTLKDGEVFTLEHSTEDTPTQGDVVVIDKLSTVSLLTESIFSGGEPPVGYIVKRVVAVPGDTITYANGTFAVNGTNAYTVANSTMCSLQPGWSHVANGYMVAGDNIWNSVDSMTELCYHEKLVEYQRDQIVAYGEIAR